MKMPDLKYFGASTSAHQVEGGNHNQWSVWELENAQDLAKSAEQKYGHLDIWEDIKEQATQPSNYVSDKAADHYNLYEHDLDILKQLNLNSYRFSIEWSRIEPEEGKWDESEIEHYRKVLRACKERDVEPFVSLWHWTVPVWFKDMGDFEKKRNIKYFVRFCKKIAEELGSDMKYIITLNEPDVYAYSGYVKGTWPPQQNSSYINFSKVMINLYRAHKKSYKVLKSVKKSFMISTAYQAAYIYSESNDPISKFIVKVTRYAANYWWLDRIKKHQDYMGFNYYFTDRIKGLSFHNSNQKTSDLGWDMQPQNVQFLIEEVYKRYKLPVIITENGVADMHDKHRKWWIQETLQAISKAQDNGVKVQGYIHWSLLDNFEWADGFWPRFGLVEVDYKTQKRTVKPSAKWYADCIKKGKLG